MFTAEIDLNEKADSATSVVEPITVMTWMSSIIPAGAETQRYPESSVGKGLHRQLRRSYCNGTQSQRDLSQRGLEHQGLGQEQPHSVPQAEEQ